MNGPDCFAYQASRNRNIPPPSPRTPFKRQEKGGAKRGLRTCVVPGCLVDRVFAALQIADRDTWLSHISPSGTRFPLQGVSLRRQNERWRSKKEASCVSRSQACVWGAFTPSKANPWAQFQCGLDTCFLLSKQARFSFPLPLAANPLTSAGGPRIFFISSRILTTGTRHVKSGEEGCLLDTFETAGQVTFTTPPYKASSAPHANKPTTSCLQSSPDSRNRIVLGFADAVAPPPSRNVLHRSDHCIDALLSLCSCWCSCSPNTSRSPVHPPSHNPAAFASL